MISDDDPHLVTASAALGNSASGASDQPSVAPTDATPQSTPFVKLKHRFSIRRPRLSDVPLLLRNPANAQEDKDNEVDRGMWDNDDGAFQEELRASASDEALRRTFSLRQSSSLRSIDLQSSISQNRSARPQSYHDLASASSDNLSHTRSLASRPESVASSIFSAGKGSLSSVLTSPSPRSTGFDPRVQDKLLGERPNLSRTTSRHRSCVSLSARPSSSLTTARGPPTRDVAPADSSSSPSATVHFDAVEPQITQLSMPRTPDDSERSRRPPSSVGADVSPSSMSVTLPDGSFRQTRDLQLASARARKTSSVSSNSSEDAARSGSSNLSRLSRGSTFLPSTAHVDVSDQSTAWEQRVTNEDKLVKKKGKSDTASKSAFPFVSSIRKLVGGSGSSSSTSANRTIYHRRSEDHTASVLYARRPSNVAGSHAEATAEGNRRTSDGSRSTGSGFNDAGLHAAMRSDYPPRANSGIKRVPSNPTLGSGLQRSRRSSSKESFTESGASEMEWAFGPVTSASALANSFNTAHAKRWSQVSTSSGSLVRQRRPSAPAASAAAGLFAFRNPFSSSNASNDDLRRIHSGNQSVEAISNSRRGSMTLSEIATQRRPSLPRGSLGGGLLSRSGSLSSHAPSSRPRRSIVHQIITNPLANDGSGSGANTPRSHSLGLEISRPISSANSLLDEPDSLIPYIAPGSRRGSRVSNVPSISEGRSQSPFASGAKIEFGNYQMVPSRSQTSTTTYVGPTVGSFGSTGGYLSSVASPTNALDLKSDDAAGKRSANPSPISPIGSAKYAISPISPSQPSAQYRRPFTSDACLEASTAPLVPRNLALASGQPVGFTSPTHVPFTHSHSMSLSAARPVSADTIATASAATPATGARHLRRPSFGLSVSPLAAAAFDSIPSPEPASAILGGARGPGASTPHTAPPDSGSWRFSLQQAQAQEPEASRSSTRPRSMLQSPSSPTSSTSLGDSSKEVGRPSFPPRKEELPSPRSFADMPMTPATEFDGDFPELETDVELLVDDEDAEEDEVDEQHVDQRHLWAEESKTADGFSAHQDGRTFRPNTNTSLGLDVAFGDIHANSTVHGASATPRGIPSSPSQHVGHLPHPTGAEPDLGVRAYGFV